MKVGVVVLVCLLLVSVESSQFPSMIFFENGTNNTLAEAVMHVDQVNLASKFALAIAGWGEDATSQPMGLHEEEKLANISALIKKAGTGTMTAVCAGQFEFVDPQYDLQRQVMEDPAYQGMFMHDDDGNLLKQGTFYIWDFRNATAVQFHTTAVTGYFASEKAPHVDAVFFDEGDSFACQYNCKAHNLCKTMPNALEWHKGNARAWLGAATIMASAGKRAILSSQNAFNGSSPELWKEDHGNPKWGSCPLLEDVPVKMISDAGVPFLRFYEYWLTPEAFDGGGKNPTWRPGTKSETWLYCRNQVANAIEEGKRPGMNFVAAGTSSLPGWGTSDRMKALEFSLGGFLIAKSRIVTAPSGRWTAGTDYFGFDHQFTSQEMKAMDCYHTRWGDCSHNWSEVQATYAKDYGEPLSDAVELDAAGSGRFFRQYSKVNVTFDCGKDGPSGAKFEWA